MSKERSLAVSRMNISVCLKFLALYICFSKTLLNSSFKFCAFNLANFSSDPEMQEQIKRTLSVGHASYEVLLLSVCPILSPLRVFHLSVQDNHSRAYCVVPI